MLQRRKFSLGIRQKPTSEVTTLEGESRVASEDMTFKAYLDGAERTVATTDQVQTLTNKIIDSDNNTISNLELSSLKAGTLNTDLSGPATDTEIPSALAVKTALEGQNEAAEIAYDPSDSSLTQTNVKTSLDEVAGRLDINETDISNTSTGLSNHLADTDAHTASAITNVASGNLVATDVQSALDELQTELDGVNSNATNNTTNLNNHINNASDVHDASAISNVPTGNLIATNAQDALNELQSDVDTRALDSDLTNHISDTSTHGVTGDIVGTSDQQTLTNKDIDGGTASDNNRITLPKETKANLDSLTRKEGTIVYATDDQSAYLDNGTNLIPVGSGSGGDINHLGKNGDADNGIGDWNSNVVLGSTIVVSETDPLRGSSSFLVTDNASGTSGDFSVLATCVFSLENADLTQKQYISFDFEKVFATFGEDQDLTIVIRQNGNSERVLVINDTVDGRDGQYLMSFDPTDVLSYRLELVRNVTNTTATAMSFKIDNIRIAPREVVKSIGKTSWNVAFTINGFSENQNEGNIGQSIVNESAQYTLYYNASRFPSGAIITPTVRIPDGTGAGQALEVERGEDATGSYVKFITRSTNGSVIGLSGTDEIFVEFKQKEEDQTAYQISTDLGNREIVSEGEGVSSNQTLTANTTNIQFDTVKDTVGAWDGSEYTVQMDGNYIVQGSLIFTQNKILDTSIYVDGVQKRTVSGKISEDNIHNFGGAIYLKRGQSLSVRVSQAATILSGDTINHWISISKQGNDAPMLGVTAPQIAIFKDVKPSGVDGGTFVSGSYVDRTINTHTGLKTFSSLASNQITLEKGRYLVHFKVPAFYVDAHKAKMISVSGTPISIIGTSEYAGNQNVEGVSTSSIADEVIDILETTTLKLVHRCNVTRNSDGLGRASIYGDDEVYSIVKIQRIY